MDILCSLTFDCFSGLDSYSHNELDTKSLNFMLLSFSRHSEVVLTSDAEEANKQAGHGPCNSKGPWCTLGSRSRAEVKTSGFEEEVVLSDSVFELIGYN